MFKFFLFLLFASNQLTKKKTKLPIQKEFNWIALLKVVECIEEITVHYMLYARAAVVLYLSVTSRVQRLAEHTLCKLITNPILLSQSQLAHCSTMPLCQDNTWLILLFTLLNPLLDAYTNQRIFTFLSIC